MTKSCRIFAESGVPINYGTTPFSFFFSLFKFNHLWHFSEGASNYFYLSTRLYRRPLVKITPKTECLPKRYTPWVPQKTDTSRRTKNRIRGGPKTDTLRRTDRSFFSVSHSVTDR